MAFMKRLTLALITACALLTVTLSTGCEGPRGPAGPAGGTGGSSGISLLISQNTTWTAASSPINVNNMLVILTGATLTIEPGVTVVFYPGSSIHVQGGIVANGTSANHIEFRPLVEDFNNDVELIDPLVAVTRSFTYVFFNGIDLEMEDSSPTLSYCKFTGMDPDIDIAMNSNPTFDHCTFDIDPQSQWSGMYIDYGSSPSFTFCIVRFGDIYCTGSTTNPTTFSFTDCDLLMTGTGTVLTHWGPPNPTATNCWWGTTVTANIDAMIYDGNDSAGPGVVAYNPIRSAATPGAGCGW
ncbi:MAG: hypothetical protein ACYS47_15770 [Planctomycetota bacterium]